MRKLFTYFAVLISVVAFAQEKDKNLSKANDQFEDKNYAEAEANYRVSESKFPKKAIASYNLGNTIYKINQPSEAGIAYRRAIENAKVRPEKHKIFHNLGNVFMKEKKYDKAVLAYKDALINDPSDEETRYNYALARKMLKEHPPKAEDKKKKDKDKKEDKNKDEKKKEEKKEQPKEGNNQENKPQNGQQQQQPSQPKPQQGGISKDRLQNLLEAVDNEEKKVQDKVNKRKEQARPVQTEKDW